MTSDLTIEAAGLEKSLRLDPVVSGISLRVSRATVFALLGPNGAGKTTTVRILSTLTAPTAAVARWRGRDVVAERAAVRRRISLTGQYAAVDGLQTGAENLRMIGRLQASRGGRNARVPASCSSASTSWRPAARWSPPTRAGCAADWTWRRPWCAGRTSCSWTSRPPAWIRAAAARCGAWSGRSSRTGSPCS